MASRMLASASSRVSPCLMQPGRAGTSATKNPSSSCSISTRYLIGNPCVCPVRPYFQITGLSAIMPSTRWLTGVGRLFLSSPTPLQAPKGVDPSEARGARIRRKADRSSTRVRIAQRDGDAGETVRAPGTIKRPALFREPGASWSRRESIRSELPNPRSEASPTRLERRTTIRARQMHQSPVSLTRAGLCEWSRRESNPRPRIGPSVRLRA
jgi:hypothetical protein